MTCKKRATLTGPIFAGRVLQCATQPSSLHSSFPLPHAAYITPPGIHLCGTQTPFRFPYTPWCYHRLRIASPLPIRTMIVAAWGSATTSVRKQHERKMRPHSYRVSLLISVDRLLAAAFFNEPDLTISSLCWIVRTGKRDRLELSSWKIRALWRIGVVLNRFFPGHLAVARSNDIAASSRMRQLLGALTP